MRRAPDMLGDDYPSPVFLMNVPATWQTVESQNLYLSELRRLGKFLERQGGTAPSDDCLADTMRRYDEARSALRNARGFLSARRFAEAIESFHRTGQVDVGRTESTPARRGIPVALVGGALLRDHFRIFDVIESAGGNVTLDATTSGERSLLPPFDRRALKDGPLMALAHACFGGVPDAFRRPNSDLYRWLKRAFAERGVRGVIFRRYVWCDTWHGEMQRMKEWAGIPLLDIESGGEVNPDGHLAGRIFAFIEMLESSSRKRSAAKPELREII
jgi:benzoyl-CoA reductase/2-hydroxyglutaryl-CoA dehydratase subunit BcrC/BadD/HgdB